MKLNLKNPQVMLGVIAALSVFLTLNENVSIDNKQTEQVKNKLSVQKVYFKESIDTSSFVRFADWCLNRDKLKQSTRNTIDRLLYEVDTLDCNLADRRLATVKSISILGKGDKAFDLRPFQSLNHLIWLMMVGLKIDNVEPLVKMSNLTNLDLSRNQISDITPLQNLTKLEELHLKQNDITDISPLVSLNKLGRLHLGENKILDITPLQNMENLFQVYLNDNLIEDETCPVEPQYTCIFFLRNWDDI